MTLNRSHKGNWPRPMATMFLTDQIRFSNFDRRSFSDHFYQIIFNSDHRFHRSRFLSLCYRDKPRPLAVMLFDGSNLF